MEGKITEPAYLVRDRQRGLNQIRQLGSKKPMGYIPLDSLSNYFLSNTSYEIKLAKDSGYKSIILGPKECDIGFTGVLFVYDEKSLFDLLTLNTEVLKRYGWPTDPEAFVRRVGKEQVSERSEIYKVIVAAFGENKNKT